MDLLTAAIRERTGITPEFHSFSYAEYNALRDLYHQNDNFLVVDVGGEITDLTTVARGQIVDSAAFSMGQNFLIKWLAEAWPSTPDEILSLIKLYLAGQMDPDIKIKIEGLLTRIKGEWLKEFRSALARSAEHHIIPAKIFLIGDSEAAKIFLTWLQAENLSEYTLAPQAVAVNFIEARTLSHFFSGEPVALGDTFLLVDALFCGKIFKALYI
jgi:hypothetical protein